MRYILNTILFPDLYFKPFSLMRFPMSFTDPFSAFGIVARCTSNEFKNLLYGGTTYSLCCPFVHNSRTTGSREVFAHTLPMDVCKGMRKHTTDNRGQIEGGRALNECEPFTPSREMHLTLHV